MRRSRPWRDDELKDVTHLYLNTSMTIDEIAQRTGRTRASVDARLGRLGIRQRQKHWNVITYDVVVKFGITTNKHALYQRWCYYTKNKGAAYAQIPSLDR